METTHDISVRMLPRETGFAIASVFAKSRGLEPPPHGMLPPEACVGFVAGIESCVMWPIRLTGTQAAIVECMITSPGLNLGAARTVILACLADIETRLQADGIKLLCASTPHDAVAREAVSAGWTADENKSIHIYKHLCCQ